MKRQMIVFWFSIAAMIATVACLPPALRAWEGPRTVLTTTTLPCVSAAHANQASSEHL
jgi:hypothetical protein